MFLFLITGFAFANVEAAAEFEEQRARFFAEQERYDDYMEMREGLELANMSGFREHVVALPDPERVPWYHRQTAFWLCSALLLSWPLRLIMEYNTAYLHYQVFSLTRICLNANLIKSVFNMCYPKYPLKLSPTLFDLD